MFDPASKKVAKKNVSWMRANQREPVYLVEYQSVFAIRQSLVHDALTEEFLNVA
jgi:hypothetical protein